MKVLYGTTLFLMKKINTTKVNTLTMIICFKSGKIKREQDWRTVFIISCSVVLGEISLVEVVLVSYNFNKFCNLIHIDQNWHNV